MTMFPSQNISKHGLRGGYSGCGGSYGGSYSCGCCLGSDLAVGDPMAEDESRTDSVNEAGSSSKEGHDEGGDQGWLQLGMGGSSHDTSKLYQAGLRPPTPKNRGSGCSNSFFLQQPGTSSIFPHHRRADWEFRPIAQNIMIPSAAAASSSSCLPLGSYLDRPFQVHGGVDVAGPSLDLRVVDPPRRPQSGIWFMLQASQNQDGRMTVRLLMKYLVNKLRLDSESEV
ncbi:hypothetical protein Acr_13g0013260 [Actinidia rufa]|uniref:Uncharacterized protein n=1 Tax=Actinidia rufa TaxID=165716 RepID=A0A7J0FNF9_9ERIC|nr:hypothetical protein Acr_13g0013260 [Actinidia rufa]